jgi:hypothetical protein
MGNNNQGSWNGEAADEINIELSIEVLAARLLADEKFIERVSEKVRKEMTKDARRLGNLFAQWAGK